jgi:hypothetical protein
MQNPTGNQKWSSIKLRGVFAEFIYQRIVQGHEQRDIGPASFRYVFGVLVRFRTLMFRISK